MRGSRLGSGCKRGQWFQFAFVIVFILAMALVYLIMAKVGGDLNDSLQDDATLGPEALAVLENHTNATSGVFDAAIMVALLGCWILCLVLAYNSGGNPLLFVLALIIIAMLGFAGMILGNTWEELTGEADFTSTVANFPMTDYVLSHYLIFVLVVGFSTVIVGYTQRGG